jgi:hypothetical protein
LIPPVFSPVFVSNENENTLAIPVIVNSSITHFSPVTTVEYSVSTQGKVELKAFDSSGKQVYITGDERSRNVSRCQKFRPVILNAIFIN